ncbi:putative calcium-channel protein [Clavispora lusitaniae]|uniref:Calcium-channel protein n=1 Tax=Clavispora lusitaniae TaxID=36911 RepID=A0ACD0WFI8_CLALS|nr:putative calcium-channel protein [Clavispora lusitaniae]QFZ31992.1 putative calcium-channel protein [Clavispora lusitaniae]QFZ37661.1 putative calcium-channel protein [Clavispora lusitaniae]QFZ43345.1 putative calcium-channel protein [Clavispora lusitaniae]QFZ49021.1 putative calcium-channel protein [Clavispora lusitaniae]
MRNPFRDEEPTDATREEREQKVANRHSQPRFVVESSYDNLRDAFTSDPLTVQDELVSALGNEGHEANWLKSPANSRNSMEISSSRRSSREASSNAYLHPTDAPSIWDHYPNYDYYPDYPETQSNYDIPLITLDHSGNADLEAGLQRLNEKAKLNLPGSPSKIPNIISRISDRIAGSNNPATPMSEKPPVFTADLESVETMDPNLTSLGTPSHSPLLRPSRPSGDGDSMISSQQLHTDELSGQITPNLQHSTSNVTTAIVHENPFSMGNGPHEGFEHLYLYGRSLRIFAPSSPFRKWCHRAAAHSATNATLLVLLFIQTTLLIFRQWNPAKLDGYVYYGNNWVEYVIAFIYFLYSMEAGVKIVAYGLIDDRIMFEELGLDYPSSWISETTRSVIQYIREVYSSYSNRFGKGNDGKGNRFRLSSKSTSNIKNPSNGFGETSLDLNSPLDNSTEYHENPFIESSSDSSQNPFNDTSSSQDRNLTRRRSDIQRRVRFHRQDSASSVVDVKPSLRIHSKNTFLKSSTIRKKVEEMNLRRAYLHNSWQIFDAISTVSFWISMILSVNRQDYDHHFMLFRALSCLRILRLCNLTTGTNIILKACYAAIPQLMDITIVIVCFWVIFAIIGVQSFKSSLSRNCVWTNPTDPSETFRNTEQFCGSYIGLDGKAKPFLNRNGEASESIKGFRCPMNSVCQSGENPYAGSVNFDNIFQSMQLVFVIMSVNAFSDLMYELMDTDNIAAALFFIFAIFILTVWLMNIFIAIIVSSFQVVQMEQAEEKRQRAERRNKKMSSFKIWMFNDELHSKRVRSVISKKPWLKRYYQFEIISLVMIATGLVIQCLRSSSMSDDLSRFIYRAEEFVTAFLCADIVLRFSLFMPYWRDFFYSKRNCFDLFLALITTVIIADPVKNKLGHAYYWLSFFQIVRFYRIVLAYSITRDLWLKILRNAKAIFDLTLFYFILLVLTSIILARFFEGTVPLSDVDDVQFAMHTLPNTFMSLYVITSTENWADIMYSLQEYARSTSQRAIGSVFLIFWFIVSNSIVMNIFIAVIANALQVSDEGKRKHQLSQFIEDVTTKLQSVQTRNDWISKMKARIFKSNTEKNMQRAVTNLLMSGSAVNDFLENDTTVERNDSDEDDKGGPIRKWINERKRRILAYFHNPFFTKHRTQITYEGKFDPVTFAKRALEERQRIEKEQDQYLRDNPMFNTVFYMLAPGHRLRRICQRIVPSSYGERIDGVEPHKKISEIFASLMFLSTIGIVLAACYVTPLYRRDVGHVNGQWNWALYTDSVLLLVFTMEYLIKITADGIIFTPNGYYRSPWNWLDFCALLSLWTEFVAFIKDDGPLSLVVRGLKALRALRILTISETAKNNFQYTIISGFGKIVSAAMMSLTLIFPFSIWALNIFNDRLGFCNDGVSYLGECVNEYSNTVYDWEIYSPRVYTEPLLQMNRFSSSFSTLYQIVSLEGWTDLLINVMQSTGSGTPQQMFYNAFNGVFVIFFNFVSVVFILTVFVSVIIDNYAKVTGRAYLTNEQIQWYNVKRFLLRVKPSKRRDPKSLKGIQKAFYNLTVGRNRIWRNTLNTVLLIHVVSLLCETYPSNKSFNVFRALAFMVSSTCFVIHYFMLAIAQSFKVFISNKWNIFSFIVSLGAWISTMLSFATNSGSVFINFNKLFLVGMLIFLFPRSDRINQLLKFAAASLPRLLSLMFTWFILYLVYAIALNQIFGMTKIGPNTSGNINVRSVPKTLILLFRCSMGEGWNYIMDDFTLEVPFCTYDNSVDDSDCGNKEYAYLLFMSWNVISMYIMLNLFVSLLLDSFSYISGGSKYAPLVARSEIRKFKKSWGKFDPKGTGFIDPEDLPKFLHTLDGSLSFHFYHGMFSIPELCSKWIHRNDPNNPYDVAINYDAINETVATMDFPKIRERRFMYERFIEEAIMNMELHEEPGISFTRLLVQLPLYNSFDSGECLVLIDYLERRLFMQKLEKRLQKKRCKELLQGYITRWAYVHRQREEKRKSQISNISTEGKQNTFYEVGIEDF